MQLHVDKKYLDEWYKAPGSAGPLQIRPVDYFTGDSVPYFTIIKSFSWQTTSFQIERMRPDSATIR